MLARTVTRCLSRRLALRTFSRTAAPRRDVFDTTTDRQRALDHQRQQQQQMMQQQQQHQQQQQQQQQQQFQQQQQQQAPPAAEAEGARVEQTLPMTGLRVTQPALQALMAQSTVPTLLIAVASYDQASLDYCARAEAKASLPQFAGRLRVASLDTAEQPEMAQAMRVQSVPTTLAIFEGKPFDAFQGPMADAELDKFLTKFVALMPTDETKALQNQLTAAFGTLTNGDPKAASELFKVVNDAAADDAEVRRLAIAGLIRCNDRLEDYDAVDALHDWLKQDIESSKDGKRASKKGTVNLSLDKRVSAGLASASLSKQIRQLDSSAEKSNVEQAFFASLTAWKEGNVDKALEEALNIVKLDKTWNDSIGRTTFVQMCAVLKADGDDRHVAANRKFQNLWFL